MLKYFYSYTQNYNCIIKMKWYFCHGLVCLSIEQRSDIDVTDLSIHVRSILRKIHKMQSIFSKYFCSFSYLIKWKNGRWKFATDLSGRYCIKTMGWSNILLCVVSIVSKENFCFIYTWLGSFIIKSIVYNFKIYLILSLAFHIQFCNRW